MLKVGPGHQLGQRDRDSKPTNLIRAGHMNSEMPESSTKGQRARKMMDLGKNHIEGAEECDIQ